MRVNSIEKQIELKAPVSRVWRALTDHREFSAWFHVNLEEPFVPGKRTRGRLTISGGHEGQMLTFTVQKMEPERLFSYTWHPYPFDSNRDYTKEQETLVEFRLKPKGNGTLLVVVESGFDAIPADRRAEAFRMHEGGWGTQLANIERHVLQTDAA